MLLFSRSIRTLISVTSLSLSLSKTSMQAIADSIPRISEKYPKTRRRTKTALTLSNSFHRSAVKILFISDIFIRVSK